MEIQSKKLSEVLFFQEGPGVRKTQFTSSGVKLLNGGNINNNKLDLSSTKTYISDEEAYGKYKHFLAKEGDLIIASSGVVVSKFDGKITFVKKEHLPLCMNTSTIRFRPLSDELNINYFYFFLKSISFKNQIQRLITGSAQLNFGPSHLQKVNISFPSPTNQLRVVKVLSQCEALIQMRKESINLINILSKSLFDLKFGDPVQNEKGWNTKTIEELVVEDRHSIKRGPFGGALKKEIFVEQGHLVYEQYHALNNDFTFARYFINDAKFEELKAFEVLPGDIIISCSGVYLGKLAIVPENAKKGIINQALLKLTLDNEIVNKQYFIALFSHQNFKQKNYGSNIGSGVPNFPPMSEFKKFKFIYPPLELQNEFALVIDSLEVIKKQYNDSLKELENLYGSIRQRAFNGELDLSKVDISDMEDSKKKDLEAVKEDITEEQLEDLMDSFEHTLPTGEVTSNRQTDIRNMSIRQYLRLPDNEETEGVEFSFMNKDYFYQFILTKGFPEGAFTLPDLEQYARKYILRGTGFEFTYENWKTIIFRFIGAKQPIIEQIFDEDDKTIKLKLTDEAFKV